MKVLEQDSPTIEIIISGGEIFSNNGINTTDLISLLAANQQLITLSSKDLFNYGDFKLIRELLAESKYKGYPHIKSYIKTIRKGSLELILGLLVDPLIISFVRDNTIFQGFISGVIANIFTSNIRLFSNPKKKEEYKERGYGRGDYIRSCLPTLVQMTEIINEKNDILCIHYKSVDKVNNRTEEFTIDSSSKEKIHEYVRTLESKPIIVEGKVTNLDLEKQRGTILEKGTNDRYYFCFTSQSIFRQIGSQYFGSNVKITGDYFSEITHETKVINLIKVINIERL